MNSNSRAVAVSTVGYLCLGLMGWMFSMGTASWFAKPYGLGIVYPLIAVLAIMGILAFVQGRGLDSIVFFCGSTLLGLASAYSVAVGMGKAVAEPFSYLGWFALLWAIFFCYIWAGSFKSGVNRMVFLLALWLTMLALAIGAWTGIAGFFMAGGYLGLIASAFAMIVSGNEVVRLGRRIDPNLEAFYPEATVELIAETERRPRVGPPAV